MDNDTEKNAKLSAKLLFAATFFALVFSNSPVKGLYDASLHTLFSGVQFSFLDIINDGLMAIFFLVVAFEIKFELQEGALNSRKKVALPLIAALGGMIIPALIYVGFNYNKTVELRGFAIPTATDIAFALSIIAFIGRRVRRQVKIFLLTLAVLDDLLAIIIIALFYTSTISVPYLIASGLVLSLFAVLNYRHVNKLSLYLTLGVVLWYCLLKAGIHPTLAGVATAFAIPLKKHPLHHSSYMTDKLQNFLNPYVMFFILPLFAFANAGVSVVSLQFSQLHFSILAGIFFGLVVGKPLGIFGSSWLASRFGFAKLPEHFAWAELFAVSFVCGIGFTMSLFIGMLAFNDMNIYYIDSVKIGVLSGSLISGILGYLFLKRASKATI